MKIQSAYPTNIYSSSKDAVPKNKTESKNGNQKKYVSATNQNVTYGKVTKSDQISIEILRNESEKAYETLLRIVMELIDNQGRVDGQKKSAHEESLRMEASKLIHDDGPLGAEAVSNRIVDFAIAISGGDKSKIEVLRGAIEEGFKQAKDILGELPEVSQKTYDLIIEKLDKWEKDI
ncbi:MAG: hypothetical protein APF76_02260 [Desulfitibacter sp. BRH_c19]|nr:MAG: hypothetical protein APF76_02260 [Desulfitibacter sp. BRH_c19]